MKGERGFVPKRKEKKGTQGQGKEKKGKVPSMCLFKENPLEGAGGGKGVRNSEGLLRIAGLSQSGGGEGGANGEGCTKGRKKD